MKILIPSTKQEYTIEFDGRKFISETLKLKKLREEIGEAVIVLCEHEELFANVFSSSEGGYAIYWYEKVQLNDFLEDYCLGEKSFEEIDGAYCTGSLRNALEWAYYGN